MCTKDVIESLSIRILPVVGTLLRTSLPVNLIIAALEVGKVEGAPAHSCNSVSHALYSVLVCLHKSLSML